MIADDNTYRPLAIKHWRDIAGKPADSEIMKRDREKLERRIDSGETSIPRQPTRVHSDRAIARYLLKTRMQTHVVVGDHEPEPKQPWEAKAGGRRST
jgi:hypothetical protein